MVGSPIYMAPEILLGKDYSSKSDIWSIGCVLFEMCSLLPPFTANSMDQLMRKCCSGVVPIINWVYSNDLNLMVKLCL